MILRPRSGSKLVSERFQPLSHVHCLYRSSNSQRFLVHISCDSFFFFFLCQPSQPLKLPWVLSWAAKESIVFTLFLSRRVPSFDRVLIAWLSGELLCLLSLCSLSGMLVERASSVGGKLRKRVLSSSLFRVTSNWVMWRTCQSFIRESGLLER